MQEREKDVLAWRNRLIHIYLHTTFKGSSNWESGWTSLSRVPVVGDYVNPRYEIGICKVVRVLHTPLEEAHAAEVWAIQVSEKEWVDSLSAAL
jgi:hypothetical protein